MLWFYDAESILSLPQIHDPIPITTESQSALCASDENKAIERKTGLVDEQLLPSNDELPTENVTMESKLGSVYTYDESESQVTTLHLKRYEVH